MSEVTLYPLRSAHFRAAGASGKQGGAATRHGGGGRGCQVLHPSPNTLHAIRYTLQPKPYTLPATT